jgi:protein involved in temperature-dependent protein secretion
MTRVRHREPVAAAHQKAVAVQDEVRQAKDNLHDANEALADTVVDSTPTKEDVEAALVQNLQVEGQLQDAVKELEVVTDLLKVAEQENAAYRDQAAAGRRSGEGIKSVLAHLNPPPDRRNLSR